MLSTTHDKCIHHWVIDIAEGPFSKGECKLCKKTANFKNSIWVETVSNAHSFDYWHRDIVGDKWKANPD